MSALREAAQQALEALEAVYGDSCDAIYALRAALAQEQAGPVDPASKMTAGRAVYFIERFKREEKLLGPNEQAALDFVISMLERQKQAKPAQGPVAWVECDGELVWNNKEAAIGRNLYTAPPRRTMVPLTAQQLDGVIERHVGGSEITDDVYASMEQFARAIEKASWEKNHG